MLLELRVENLLLIERAELRLGPELNAITGETGAGKTVLAHALDLLLGGRPRSGIVRPGAGEAYVEGVFSVPDELFTAEGLEELRERLPDDLDEIVLGRRVSAEGRTRAFIQGRSASASDLRELGGRLVSFYGQHEHRKLTLASAQLQALDRFCGPEHLAELSAFAASHARVLVLRKEVQDLRERAGARDRDRDLLMFELEEIDALRPTEEERDALAAERQRLRGLDELTAGAGAAAETLAPELPDAPGVLALIADGERQAQAAAGLDPQLAGIVERLTALRLEAEDLAAELRRYGAELAAEPGRLDEVEERLDLYDRLERKHGGSVASVLAHGRRCREELERLELSEISLERAEADLAAATTEEDARADALTLARRRAAPLLAERVRVELASLAMEGAAFDVRLHAREQRGSTGDERAEFVIAPNPGVPAAPLRDTASGGELSRAMLALMSVASGDAGHTLVFDEVDAGIGGQTARAVGERLRRLSVDAQVLCITHLPQIASLAEHHFRIEKEPGEGVARASVERLEGAGVVEELCRMLGADTDDAGARRHAKELLAAA